MQFTILELAFFIPFCLGRILDNAPSQQIEGKVISKSNDGVRNALKPFLSIRTGPSKMTEITLGDGKFLECEAGGNPATIINWLKDGKKIGKDMYEFVHQSEVLPSQLGLGFTRSRLYMDCASSGQYTCMAENEFRHVTRSGIVLVTDPLDGDSRAMCLSKSLGSPARIHMWTHSRLEMMGTDAQLFCRSSGEPQPQVVWRGTEGEILRNSRKYQIMETGDLIVRSLEWADMGGYTCQVTNSEGSDEASAFLYPTLSNSKVPLEKECNFTPNAESSYFLGSLRKPSVTFSGPAVQPDDRK